MSDVRPSPPPFRYQDAALRALALAFLWWVLSGGAMESWAVGLPAVALALWASLRLAPDPGLRISLPGALALFGFFVLRSVKGGVQVASMALRPRLDMRPAELELDLRLRPGRGQLLLASALCLMPGTLATAVEGNRLRLHLLDERLPAEREVRALERRVARMLGERLS